MSQGPFEMESENILTQSRRVGVGGGGALVISIGGHVTDLTASKHQGHEGVWKERDEFVMQ